MSELISKAKCAKCGETRLRGIIEYEVTEEFEVTDKGVQKILKTSNSKKEIYYMHCPNCGDIDNKVLIPKKCEICGTDFYAENDNDTACENCSKLASLSKEELIKLLLKTRSEESEHTIDKTKEEKKTSTKKTNTVKEKENKKTSTKKTDSEKDKENIQVKENVKVEEEVKPKEDIKSKEEEIKSKEESIKEDAEPKKDEKIKENIEPKENVDNITPMEDIHNAIDERESEVKTEADILHELEQLDLGTMNFM